MALILLIVIGCSAGWLASIFARTEEPREVLRQMGVGLIASIAAGLLTNSGTILGSLGTVALFASIAASAGALAIYHFYIRQRIEL
ncbi:hypothetical protein [Qipengyuania nanhaisediminis]|uniref:hypothetical protein n=1 Tax=Qipengyuania nanhaisediminis TaxID=604088 RepID=UPI0038B33828